MYDFVCSLTLVICAWREKLAIEKFTHLFFSYLNSLSLSGSGDQGFKGLKFSNITNNMHVQYDPQVLYIITMHAISFALGLTH
jgi:hypothetical protein